MMRFSNRMISMIFFLAVVVAYGQQAKAASLPDISILKGEITFCGEPVPFDNRDIRERLDKELLLLGWDQPQIILWLKRSGRYFPAIEKILKENDMPEDLKYLAVLESGLRSSAGSSKGAVGFWQFIQPTGRRYGLIVTRDIDERRNFQLSTRAAVRYLKKLYEQFGSWALAAAAYNMGEKRLEDALKDQGVADYYQCDLFTETERYVPKILVIKTIFSNPSRFGITIDPADYYKPVEVDQVILSNAENVPVRLIAEAAGSYYKEIRDLNPEIRKSHLVRGSRMLALPKGSAGTFHAHYPTLFAQWAAQNKKVVYVVEKGDSLSMVAQRFKVTLSMLLAWNEIKQARHLYPGEKLIIHK